MLHEKRLPLFLCCSCTPRKLHDCVGNWQKISLLNPLDMFLAQPGINKSQPMNNQKPIIVLLFMFLVSESVVSESWFLNTALVSEAVHTC